MKKSISIIAAIAVAIIAADSLSAQSKTFKLGQWAEIHSSIIKELNRSYVDSLPVDRIMKAGIEANPLYTPEVMADEVRRLRLTEPCFYFARELKRVNDYEVNKIRFTRLAGAIVYPGGAYAVYNYREEMLKWMGEGEVKIKHHLHTIFTPMISYEFPLREAAIIFGADYDVALNMLKEFYESFSHREGK